MPVVHQDCLSKSLGLPGRFLLNKSVFTAQRHASAVYVVVLCLSVLLKRETAKRRLMQTTQHDSPETLKGLHFSDAEPSSKTQTGSPQTEARNAGGVC